MDTILQWLVAGISIGLVYALFGVGYTLMFSVMRCLNVAHAANFVWAALVACWLSDLQIPHSILIVVVVLGAVAAGIIGGILVQLIALRGLVRRGTNAIDIEMASFLATLGAFFILQSAALEWTHARALSFNFDLLKLDAVNIGSVILPIKYLVVGAAAIVSLALVAVVLRLPIGRYMRATADNRLLATVLGIDVRRTQVIAMVLAGAMAGFGGALIAYLYGQATFGLSHSFLLKAIVIGIVAGLGSINGAAIVAVALGLIEAITIQYFGSAWRDVSSFIIVVVVLAVRPEGIFWKQQRTAT